MRAHLDNGTLHCLSRQIVTQSWSNICGKLKVSTEIMVPLRVVYRVNFHIAERTCIAFRKPAVKKLIPLPSQGPALQFVRERGASPLK